MSPSRNPIAAEHLSESSNSLNMKRFLVNAQVTAMISSIEFIFFTVHVVGVSVAGGTNAGMPLLVMVMYMILFLIISPYSYLMNTSHNKNRIIEHGWINVIKNMTINNSIFRSTIFLVICKDNSHENPDNEIFSIQDNGRMETNSIAEDNASAYQNSPSFTTLDTRLQKIQRRLNGMNRNENQQDYKHYSEASSVLGNVNEEEIDNDNCDQLNKQNTNAKNRIMYKNQDVIDLTLETSTATSLRKTDSISIETIYL